MHILNIKNNNPPADVAVANMINEIEVCKLGGINVLKIIHGYGSGGKGGLIKKECDKALKLLKQKKVITNYISGEKCTSSLLYENLKKDYPEIIADSDFAHPNAGITIILI